MKYLLFVADKDIWLKKKDIAYEEFKDIEATPQGIFQPEMIYELGKDIGYKERVDKEIDNINLFEGIRGNTILNINTLDNLFFFRETTAFCVSILKPATLLNLF